MEDAEAYAVLISMFGLSLCFDVPVLNFSLESIKLLLSSSLSPNAVLLLISSVSLWCCSLLVHLTGVRKWLVEGESKGKAGWSVYLQAKSCGSIERRERVLASKISLPLTILYIGALCVKCCRLQLCTEVNLFEATFYVFPSKDF
ncbi:hypothetical protein Dimus_032134 [Dionaea muscipula]